MIDIERWIKQHAEWRQIGRELAEKRPGEPVTAYQVTLEQKKRMLARGDSFYLPVESAT